MSEAEKSVAVKRKVAVTRPLNRKSSPAEYSPKRRRPLSPGEKPSPPPYIPSRKVKGGTNSSSQSSSTAGKVAAVAQKVLSRDDIRHSLGRDDSRRLISASRREELLKNVGSLRSSASSLVSQSQHSSMDDKSSRIKSGISSVTYGREVRGDNQTGDVKNLQITARVGPLRANPSKDSSSQKNSSDMPLRVTVVSDKAKESSHVSLIDANKNVKKSQLATWLSKDTRSAAVPDAREEIQKSRKVSGQSNSKQGARVISKLAREAVQRQCEAAVMSVTSASAGSIKAKGSSRSSPDSRVVRCESEPPTSGDEQEDGESRAQVIRGSDSVTSDDSDSQAVVIQSPKISLSSDKKDPIVSPQEIEKGNAEVEEVEDLSQMLEGEDLDSQLLLEEEEKNEFTLDLDDEELSHVVEEVAAEVAEADKEDSNSSKSGIRFIVTLDGVDETQFDNKTVVSDKPPTNTPNAVAPQELQPSASRLPTSTLPPSTPARPPLASAQPLPQLTSTPVQTAAKMRPPKIQPFSISLRDSDDEHEEKVVTYIQASDMPSIVHTVESGSEEELSTLQLARSQERCRYWPACMAGSECQYHHPTAYCKTFPNCKFGDKCLFIHPNCRFDSKCTRADCPFTHTSRRRPSQLIQAPMPPPRHYPRYPVQKQPQQAIICHFFPNCLNPSCPFVHPKPCMFGAACKNTVCSFYHPPPGSPPVPDKGKLKWQAQTSVQSKAASLVPAVTRSSAVSSTSL